MGCLRSCLGLGTRALGVLQKEVIRYAEGQEIGWVANREQKLRDRSLRQEFDGQEQPENHV